MSDIIRSSWLLLKTECPYLNYCATRLQFYGGNRTDRNGHWYLLKIFSLFSSLDAVLHAVEYVYEQSDQQPNTKTNPSVNVQFRHQVNVQQNAQARYERDQRNLNNENGRDGIP